MVRIAVEVTSGSHLKTGGNSCYLELNFEDGYSTTAQLTNKHPNDGEYVDFNEIFEFDANPGDNLEMRLKQGDQNSNDYIGSSSVSLSEVFRRGYNQEWYHLFNHEEYAGKVQLKIQTD
ncbi:hypothetical protein CONCODRAFT_170303 [Conidiobolus coronatus NRRL 28638]|uniref:C2 domain-containing protein n=1 Tax=Conidiobolus coronatus (strain ATCC 28846 / CBS 209.66 / NRRL 28638) TaxID=796925 RepID=A0A137P780_CONC2|nr:hypothetical protein CONCODRAFT_170303 [Conidiobolus coronatus NRRL 28638]|eukprot:KXN70877.1 hypothetical protein CONCODRAFT_170303 [Conidiobolus coronatus NRRL 28638]